MKLLFFLIKTREHPAPSFLFVTNVFTGLIFIVLHSVREGQPARKSSSVTFFQICELFRRLACPPHTAHGVEIELLRNSHQYQLDTSRRPQVSKNKRQANKTYRSRCARGRPGAASPHLRLDSRLIVRLYHANQSLNHSCCAKIIMVIPIWRAPAEQQ